MSAAIVNAAPEPDALTIATGVGAAMLAAAAAGDDAALAALERSAAWSANTRRAYARAWSGWSAWSAAHERPRCQPGRATCGPTSSNGPTPAAPWAHFEPTRPVSPPCIAPPASVARASRAAWYPPRSPGWPSRNRTRTRRARWTA